MANICIFLVASSALAAAYADSEPRTLLTTRKERRLPGSKNSTPAKKAAPTPVNCVGSWGTWSACAASQRKQTYTVSTNAKDGGAACPKANGATQTEACVMAGPVNCAGSWGGWGACVTVAGGAEETRKYTVSVAASNGGAACPKADGASESQACDSQMKKDVDWKYVIPKASWGSAQGGTNGLKLLEIPIVACPKGGTVTFRWTESHDVWKLASESAYVNCAFKDSQSTELAKSTTNQYTFACTEPGTHFFACSMNSACQQARQRIRVQVVDSSKVASLKTTVDSVTGEVVPTMSSIMMNDIANVDYNGFTSDTQAASIVTRLESALRYSPTSCSDWIPANVNSDKMCKAALNSDLGFVMRARPTPNSAKSRDYYALSLKEVPDYCGTLSYLAQLELKENRKEEAIAAATKACGACGASLDVLTIADSFQKKMWALPASCVALVPKVTTTTTKKAADASQISSALLSASASASALLLSLVALAFGNL